MFSGIVKGSTNLRYKLGLSKTQQASLMRVAFESLQKMQSLLDGSNFSHAGSTSTH